MEPEYEIQTMKKDIERLTEKTAINEAASPMPTDKQAAGGPLKESLIEKLPGASLPSEPMVSAPVELPERPESTLPPIPPEAKEKFPRTRKVFILIILVMAILLIGAGFYYYWWNYVRFSQSVEFLKVDEFEIIKPLNIDIPLDISRALGKKYIFFVYKQENRVGFVAEITKREILELSLKDWEITMPEDLKPIFLGQKLGEPAAEAFRDGLYKGVNIRYLNFIDSALAIDYALVGNYFVITTSKESMYQVIDRILTSATP